MTVSSVLCQISKAMYQLNDQFLTRAHRYLYLSCLLFFLMTMFDAVMAAQESAYGANATYGGGRAVHERTAHREEIITYGTRTDKSQHLLAYTSNILSEAELERELPRTVPEALLSIPGVLVQKTASGHGSPYIRGFTGNRTLAVIDGIRYNNATYRDGANEYFSHIDSFSLESIELLSGPASTLYGSEAVGGTLSLRTKSSDYWEKPYGQSFFNSHHVLRVSSGDHSTVFHSSADFGEGEVWGLTIGGATKSYGSVRAAEIGELPRTGYDEEAFNLRFDARLANTWDFTLVHQALVQDDVPRTHSTIFSVPFAGTTVGTDLDRYKDQERKLSYVKLSTDQWFGWADKAEFTLAYQPRTETETRIRDDLLHIDQYFASDLTSFSAVMSKAFNEVSILYGIDMSSESIDSGRTDTDLLTASNVSRVQGPVGDDALYQMAGIYSELEWIINEQFKLDIGLRASAISSLVGKFEDPLTGEASRFEDSWTDISTSIRGMYRTNNHRYWFAISESFRAPNIADVSRFGRSRSNEFEIASTSLNPETFVTAELGYRYLGELIDISMTVYETDLNNYIATSPTGRVIDGLVEAAKQNSARGKIRGIELVADYHITDQLKLTGHLTWLEGDLEVNSVETNALATVVTEPISRIQPLTYYVALDWGGSNTSFKAELTRAEKADRLSSADLSDTQRIPPDGTPAYTLLNVRSEWQLHEKASISVSAINLLDEAYRSHGSGTNEPGRHTIFALNLDF